ncbi:MAG: hypothetical protein IT443_10660 [Phycisphaeraceae bacterium]|nr:hypothetical protein [Phycisphaeraceae bacterium]
MLKLATLLDNPGEPRQESRYRDPAQLKALGYTGLVLYESTSLSGIASPEDVGPGEWRRWLEQQFEAIDQTIIRARRAGLDVYLSYDVLCLPRDLVLRDPSALTCKGRVLTLCPASETALERSSQALDALMARWPDLSGIVLRFGDNEASRLPYLTGNDIYMPHCPRCSRMSRADRVVSLIDHFYRRVVQQHDKTLIVRAWNVHPDGMHDSPDLCRKIADRLPNPPQDPKLILAFKFTQTDFWRYQQWNQSSLLFGGRPIIYELQCQREFEGKGGMPNWQVPLWRDGHPETDAPGTMGLAQVAGQVNLAGLLAWVRGGGWGGPFIKNETWIDANVVAVPRLADNPHTDPQALADHWIESRLGLSGPPAEAVKQVLAHSPEVIRNAFYIGPYARSLKKPWHPSGDFIQDDLIDAKALWRTIQHLPDDKLDDVMREKQAAVDQIAHDRALLQHVLNPRTHSVLDPLLNTLLYAESLFSTLRDLTDGLIAYRRYQRTSDRAQAEQCAQRLFAAQSDWNHHSQRHGSMAGSATAFREAHLWELTQQILGEVH